MKPDLLVIDDDEIIWILIKDMLQELGLVESLTTFSDGEAALDYLARLDHSQAPPLIMLDLNLPFLSGLEFLEIYQREHCERLPNTGIYILSSSIRESDRTQTLKYPFVRDFISKPLKIERLKAVLEAKAPHNVFSPSHIHTQT